MSNLEYNPLTGPEILDLAGEKFAELLSDLIQNNERLQPHLVIHNPTIEIRLVITGDLVDVPIEAETGQKVESGQLPPGQKLGEPVKVEAVVTANDKAPDRLRQQIGQNQRVNLGKGQPKR